MLKVLVLSFSKSYALNSLNPHIFGFLSSRIRYYICLSWWLFPQSCGFSFNKQHTVWKCDLFWGRDRLVQCYSHILACAFCWVSNRASSMALKFSWAGVQFPVCFNNLLNLFKRIIIDPKLIDLPRVALCWCKFSNLMT